MDCSQTVASSVHGDSPGKNTGVGHHALLQEIFSTQGSNPGLLHCRQILYWLSYQGRPPVHILANNAVTDIGVHISFQISVIFSSDMYSAVELLGHMVAPFLVLRGNSILLSLVTASLYISTNSVFMVPFSTHLCQHSLFVLFLITCCWVAKLCPTVCDPMDCSMPGFPVLHHLPGFVIFYNSHSDRCEVIAHLVFITQP